MVFNDAAGTGVLKAGDANLAGWTIDALQNGKVVASTVSTTTGYQITGLAAGTYTIAEVAQAGYIQTAPATTFTVNVAAGQAITSENFGDKHYGLFPTAASIGSPTLTGSASLSSGTYTVIGSGKGISSTSDQFEFDYANVSGSTTLIATIASLTNTNASADAGTMIRATTAANSAFADVVVTPGKGVEFQWRTVAGDSVHSVILAGYHTPASVKLVRSGNVFSAYVEKSNNTWLQIGTSQTIAFGANALAGLAVTSDTTNSRCTGSFTGVSLNGKT